MESVKLTIFNVLFLIFLTLKLTHVISWSWWWVTAPLWGGIAVMLAIVLGVGLIAAIVAVTRSLGSK